MVLVGTVMVSGGLWAGGHGEVGPTDDEVLVAIKEALVDEAREAETRVVNLAWLDAKGQMHESTMLQSDTRVRGVQVKRYLDEAAKPRIEVALDEKQAAIPACFAHDDHLTRLVGFSAQVSGDSPGARNIATQMMDQASMQLRAGLERSIFWTSNAQPISLDRYTALLTGHRNRPAHYQLDLEVTAVPRPASVAPTVIPGSDPISTYFWGRPSVIADQWMQASLQLTDIRTDEVLWQAAEFIQIPPRPVTYGGDGLPESAKVVLEQAMWLWLAELDAFAECTPFQLALKPFATDRFVIDGGQASGMSIGDRVLVMDRRHIPTRVLEPGALSTLALARVVRVSETQAEIVAVAGAPLDDLEHKVALPF